MKGGLSGFSAWLVQRASAVYLLLFIVFIPLYIWQGGIRDYKSWQGLLAEPVIALGWALFFLALVAHAWVGVRDILIDYVHGLAVRMLLLAVLAIVLLMLLLWALGILLLNSGVML